MKTEKEEYLQFPAPYFGGKSNIAKIVWQYLGNVKTYIEPFCGSAAVLLKRPNYNPNKHKEIINDADGFITNVFRSLKFSPDETAQWCDWPVNQADLSARKLRLIANEKYLLDNLMKDEIWHNPQLAGYWLWAASCWIGSGLLSINQRPHLGSSGMGVHKIGKRPHLSNSGKGVHKSSLRPDWGNVEINENKDVKDLQEPFNTNLYKWFRILSERLRYVWIFCGDWTRVCGGNWQNDHGICGMFFDPPYSKETGRYEGIYHKENMHVSHDVREWCKKRGNDSKMRIILAGYFEEHQELLDCGWSIHRWKAGGGYASLAGNQKINTNRFKEALFVSPYCLKNNLF